MKIQLPKLLRFKFRYDKHIPIIVTLILFIAFGSLVSGNKIYSLQNLIQNLTSEKNRNFQELQKISKELGNLKNQDPHKKNDELQKQIIEIQNSYKKAVSVYENLLDFSDKSKNIKVYEKEFAEALNKLSLKDYSGANDMLNSISEKIKQEEAKLATSFTIPENITQTNTPPGSGYSRQKVSVEGLGSFMVSIIAADISTTKVIVDTAADSDCSNDCPVLPLVTYVSRNNAFAGVNGSYFCPAAYPSCTGKTNTFDLLLMNYKKTYFNSGNNVYSSNPGVIFGDNYIRFVTSVFQWGRDTSPYGVLSNFPMLVFNSNVVFNGDIDPKHANKGGRSFVANKGNNVYIGVVHSATVSESAKVLKTMGMENALNLDDGGSTALWSGSYKVGPGRDLPNVILFVKK